MWAGAAYCVQRLATGWTVREASNPGMEERHSAPVRTDHGAHQSPTESVPGHSRGKEAGACR